MTTHADYNDILAYEFATRKWTTLVKDKPGVGYMQWSTDSTANSVPGPAPHQTALRS